MNKPVRIWNDRVRLYLYCDVDITMSIQYSHMSPMYIETPYVQTQFQNLYAKYPP